MKIAIAGAGKLGVTLAETFMSGGNEVTLIDKDGELLQRVSSRLDIMTVSANAKKAEVLTELGIAGYDLFIGATDFDERNMVLCAFAKHLGCPCVIARVRSADHVTQLPFVEESLGIDHIVNPDMSCAKEIFKYLTEKYSLQGGRYSADGYAMLEMAIEQQPGLIGKKLMEIPLSSRNMVIAAVSREGRIIVPNGSTELLEGDILYVMGSEERIEEMSRRMRKVRTSNVRRVMIAGGGKTGYFLADMLEKHGVAVKVIEIDKDRCAYLSNKLENVLVLRGDASDNNLLSEENIESMDAFVAVTGFDEENLLLSLVAKRCGVPDVVSKVSRKNYSAITDDLGASMIINPVDMCVTDILRYVQRDRMAVFSQMIQGQAEIVRVTASAGMSITGKSLAEAGVPKDMLFVALKRGAETIIPNGSTVIKEGDRLIILSLLSALPELEALISVS
ncbi:MAG: Trk system potassium transporter TrkA [Firmicutes bacterium]|nr:Trk system potassium transporter TrkA [Bacillota bacterium]